MATKISLKQLGQDILDLLNKSGDAKLEKEIISNVTVGAAAAGSTFPKAQTFTEFAEKILRKDITPTISTSFSGSGVKEIGTTVNGSTIVLNITNIGQVTVPINEINFYDGNTLLATQPYQDGTTSYQYVYNQSITNDKTLKAELIYNTNQKTSGQGSFTFVYASYHGKTALPTLTAGDANNLMNSFAKELKTNKALTWDNITLNDERFCYMYPKSLGPLTSIKDGNGFSQMDSYTRLELNLTSPINGDNVDYYVYLLTDATTGTGFKQIYG